jgi:hypothetical protein
MYYATEPNQTAGITSRNNLLAHTGSLFTEVMNNTVQRKQQIMGLNYKLGSELIKVLISDLLFLCISATMIGKWKTASSCLMI